MGWRAVQAVRDERLMGRDLLQMSVSGWITMHLNASRRAIRMSFRCPLAPCAQIRNMASHRSTRHALFRQRWFADEVIVTCVRWYLRFKLSYRDVSALAGELGVRVAPSTILRWVVRYAP